MPSSVRNVGAKSTFALGTSIVDALLQIGPGGNQRVVDIPRARAAVAGGSARRDGSPHAVRVRVVGPVRREQNLRGPIVIPSHGVERQRAWRRSRPTIPAAIARVKIAPTPAVCCSAATIARHRRAVAVADVDRAAARDDARRAVGKRAGERLQDRVEIDAAGVRRKAVVRRHPDVVAVEQPRGFEAVFDPLDLAVDVPQDRDGCRVRRSLLVRRGVEIAEPQHRHRRIHARNADFQERVDRVSIERARRRAVAGRRTDAPSCLRASDSGSVYSIVQDRAARHACGC